MMSTTSATAPTDRNHTEADRATRGEQVWSLWRPAVVNGLVPVLIGTMFGWHYGFGSGWLVTTTRVLGWAAAALGAWWFWWSEGMFLKRGISLNPNWRKRPLTPWAKRTSPYPRVAPIVTGPYRHTQAPMFFGVYNALIAAGFLLSYWVFGWAVVVITGLTLWIRRRERPELLERFPPLRDWMATTPPLIPYKLLPGLALGAVYWMFRIGGDKR
jgi:protein-S-isoprenylcysteine O-methyltransferase Ste14